MYARRPGYLYKYTLLVSGIPFERSSSGIGNEVIFEIHMEYGTSLRLSTVYSPSPKRYRFQVLLALARRPAYQSHARQHPTYCRLRSEVTIK